MSELLLEIFSEEIPSRLQDSAAKRMEERFKEEIRNWQLNYKTLNTFVTPRRTTVLISGLVLYKPPYIDERRGPRINSPEKAISAFANSMGLKVSALSLKKTEKGEFYFGLKKYKKIPTQEILPKIISNVFLDFYWPKTMRWDESGIKWIRPIRSILCLFNRKLVPLSIGNIKSVNYTYGHSIFGDKKIIVKNFSDYERKLIKHCVEINYNKRRSRIISESNKIARLKHCIVEDNKKLVDELVGLSEWPTALIGQFDNSFLRLPHEVLKTTMNFHQKYLSLIEKKGKKLSSKYISISNLPFKKHHKTVIEGNNRVLRARLNDAKFFWDKDRAKTFETYKKDLKNIVFHKKLGTLDKKVERLEALCLFLAEFYECDVALLKTAAKLSKNDLVTQMVIEFPELQGVMGKYYALADNLSVNVANAICNHYKPVGQNDSVPNVSLDYTLALSDKLDTLIGFFGVGEIPSGSKDPFALRRSTIGIIRIILTNKLKLPLLQTIRKSCALYKKQGFLLDEESTSRVIEFIEERSKIIFAEMGLRQNIIKASFNEKHRDNLLFIYNKISMLTKFLSTSKGEDLIYIYKRITNILEDAKKKEKILFGEIKQELLIHQSETNLYKSFKPLITSNQMEVVGLESKLEHLSGLRENVDSFFDNVVVNDKRPEIRQNRMNTLHKLKESFHSVADFSEI